MTGMVRVHGPGSNARRPWPAEFRIGRRLADRLDEDRSNRARMRPEQVGAFVASTFDRVRAFARSRGTPYARSSSALAELRALQDAIRAPKSPMLMAP